MKTAQSRHSKVCRCRAPKRSIDCAYCGTRCLDCMAADRVCGVCHEAGIDGHVLRGTGRVVCAQHKKGVK